MTCRNEPATVIFSAALTANLAVFSLFISSFNHSSKQVPKFQQLLLRGVFSLTPSLWYQFVLSLAVALCAIYFHFTFSCRLLQQR